MPYSILNSLLIDKLTAMNQNIIKKPYLKIISWGLIFATLISSCGKASTASSTGLNIQYDILNLSPDLYPVNLYIDFVLVNKNPIIFNVNQGYFYVPSIDVPYQIRSATGTQTPLFNRTDILKSRAKYTLFITGAVGNNTLTQIFTVDTAITPKLGSGKIRFLNASPTETAGLDITANDTLLFGKVTYPNYSNFMEVPVGNYDFKIKETGSATSLKELPSVTIQDGRLYTIYAYGYKTRTDSATFNAAVIINK